MTLREAKAYMEPYKLSVVVPCYNESEGASELHRRVSQVCRACVGTAYEIVLIYDGSSDDTWAVLLSLCTLDANVVAINLSRNHGHRGVAVGHRHRPGLPGHAAEFLCRVPLPSSW